MATLKDIELSQQGEAKKQKSNDVVTTSTYIPTNNGSNNEPKQRFVIFKAVKKRRRLWLHGVCDNVKNPKTGKRERIYLITGAPSIWQSDLYELLKDRDYVSRNRRSVLFEDGIAMVKADDELALEYLRNHKDNVGSKDRSSGGKYDFYEYNPAREQQTRLERQMLKINTVLKIKEMPADKMKKLASYFNILFVDELGMPKGDDGVRTELMIRADNNPDLINKYIDSQEVEISYLVKKAIIDAKIDLTGQNGNAIWAGGKGFICKIPAGRKAYEYLTELAMTNSDEGRNFQDQLKTIVS